MITQRASSCGTVEAKRSRIVWSSAPRLLGFEIVSRVTPGAGSSISSRPPLWPSEPGALVENNERVALGHRLTLGAANLLDDSGILGLDRHFHLHRLEDDHRVALLHGVADLDLDLPDRARDVGLDLGQVSLLCSWDGPRIVRPGDGGQGLAIPQRPAVGSRTG